MNTRDSLLSLPINILFITGKCSGFNIRNRTKKTQQQQMCSEEKEAIENRENLFYRK